MAEAGLLTVVPISLEEKRMKTEHQKRGEKHAQKPGLAAHAAQPAWRSQKERLGTRQVDHQEPVLKKVQKNGPGRPKSKANYLKQQPGTRSCSSRKKTNRPMEKVHRS